VRLDFLRPVQLVCPDLYVAVLRVLVLLALLPRSLTSATRAL